ALPTRSSLSLRGRETDVVMLLSNTGRAVFITNATRGSGPDRLLLERLPASDIPLPIDDWSFGPDGLRLPDGSVLGLIGARETPTEAIGTDEFGGRSTHVVSVAVTFLPGQA
ncbi:MAG: hypothetical protein HQM09_22745, partial [Candidatus Riflebacteria bacterium]|nr:hypothetical protein [Candidatus Riflebacteria bacterium]